MAVLYQTMQRVVATGQKNHKQHACGQEKKSLCHSMMSQSVLVLSAYIPAKYYRQWITIKTTSAMGI